MEGLRVRLLGSDAGVTGHAAGCHPARVPERGVAGGASSAEIRVGGHAVDRITRLRVERAGIEKDAALKNAEREDDQ